MAVKISPEAKKYIKTNFNDKQLNKLDKIIENQKNNKYDILIYTKTKDVSTGWKDNGKTWAQVFKKVEYLVARVKEREFKKGILSSDISTIKKAEKYSNKLQKGEKPIAFSAGMMYPFISGWLYQDKIFYRDIIILCT